MGFFTEDPEMEMKYKEIISERISLVDIITNYGIMLEKNDDLLCKIYCLFHSGKEGGRERTPSFTIYKATNSFHCFGCNRSGGVVEFVSQFEGIPITIAIKKLAKKIGLINEDGKWDELSTIEEPQVYDYSKVIEPYILEMNHIIRSHINKYINSPEFNSEMAWVDLLCQKLDKKIETLENDDFERAIVVRDKLISIINKRR